MMIKKSKMDRFRISYRCSKMPDVGTGLFGFEHEKQYTGRAYNGMFEVSSEWGRGKPTVLLEKKVFTQYFEVVPDNLVKLA